LGLVRIQKDGELERGTYKLKRVGTRTGQDMERTKPARGTYKLERAKVGTGQDTKSK